MLAAKALSLEMRSSHKKFFSVIAFLRPFAGGLYRKLSKGKREKIKQRLLKKNIKIVRQYVDANGRKRVTLSMQ